MNNFEDSVSKYINYIKEKIDNTEIITHPFPHVVIENYLPQEMYDFIMEAYKVAIKEKYRFSTYGDAMLII